MTDWNDRDDAVDIADPASWPDDSYAGHERDLADQLDDTTMDSLSEVHDTSNDFAGYVFGFFTMLMMHEGVLLAATGNADKGPLSNTWVYIRSLRDHIQENANENSGDYFEIRVRQRLEEGG